MRYIDLITAREKDLSRNLGFASWSVYKSNVVRRDLKFYFSSRLEANAKF